MRKEKQNEMNKNEAVEGFNKGMLFLFTTTFFLLLRDDCALFAVVPEKFRRKTEFCCKTVTRSTR